MTPFSTLSAGVQTKLEALAAMAGVSLVQEDSQNIVTEIAKATGAIGMLVLLGIPDFKNKDGQLADKVNATIQFQILVREVPAIWRRSSNANAIHCSDLGQVIAPALQGLWIQGFQKLRVISGESRGNGAGKNPNNADYVFQDYVLEIETMQIFS